MLEVVNLVKHYGKTRAVDGISLENNPIFMRRGAPRRMGD
ncbi:hypothetical protein HKBW3S06_01665, partial [Candidatus Hakubella thermalkaliphila]